MKLTLFKRSQHKASSDHCGENHREWAKYPTSEGWRLHKDVSI